MPKEEEEEEGKEEERWKRKGMSWMGMECLGLGLQMGGGKILRFERERKRILEKGTFLLVEDKERVFWNFEAFSGGKKLWKGK